LELNRIRDKRRRAPTKYIRGRIGRRGVVVEGKRVAWLTDPVAQLLELPFMKNVLVVLGEEFVDPQKKGLFLDVN